jgi:hypothetical protein
VCGNFSQGAGTSGTGSDIAFSQLAVKGLNWLEVKSMALKKSRCIVSLKSFLFCERSDEINTDRKEDKYNYTEGREG